MSKAVIKKVKGGALISHVTKEEADIILGEFWADSLIDIKTGDIFVPITQDSMRFETVYLYVLGELAGRGIGTPEFLMAQALEKATKKGGEE